MSLLIDLFATASLFGIWPRFIEPRLLKTTYLTWKLPAKAEHLAGIRIAHLTDLHFHDQFSLYLLKKIKKRVLNLCPDIIVFTGDFLCYSRLQNQKWLLDLLNALQAPLGSYCIFGNHDYASYISLNRHGIYDLASPIHPLKGLVRGIRTLFSPTAVGTAVSDKAAAIPFHAELCDLLRSTPFKLLENETTTLPIGLNITGLGDLALGRCHPEKAFASYDHRCPGIVLTHNPDSLPLLYPYPGEWILCGHTHGEQIHLPWPKWGRRMTRKLARLKNTHLTRGLLNEQGKTIYINRGLGCHKPFRLFSPPEISLICATKSQPV